MMIVIPSHTAYSVSLCINMWFISIYLLICCLFIYSFQTIDWSIFLLIYHSQLISIITIYLSIYLSIYLLIDQSNVCLICTRCGRVYILPTWAMHNEYICLEFASLLKTSNRKKCLTNKPMNWPWWLWK